VGALKNGEYFYEGNVYKLSRHGFARDFEFEVIENSENTVVFSLKSNEETLKVYPFYFELQLSYILEGNKLVVKYEIINRSSEKCIILSVRILRLILMEILKIFFDF
jgi:galactose mutarotase-like enzyme